MTDSPLVRLERHGDVGVIIVNNPPVNALSPGVPEGIVACLNEGLADAAIKAMVLIGDGRSFIAGADIAEFRDFDARGTVNDAIFRGQQVFQRIAELPCPTVAAIHGFCRSFCWIKS